ncbi:MAG TPA: FtsX-like permease family protein, partial [Acidobacteriota bacterium]|nr:FtsX-like permease family protein [Acidobacteriota bacterium]
QDGELSPLENYAFFRQDEAKEDGFPLTIFLIRLRPGTPRAFEEKLITQFQSVAKEWSFEAQFLADMRESKMKMYLVPLAAAGSIVTFLMLMVALGLIGVLWQSVTRRTREIGVRRAFGATAGNVYLQILGELLAVTTVSLVAGTAVVGQLPLIDIFGFIQGKVFVYSLLASIGIMYLLTLICGLYPSWIATRVHPSQALHYD